jgi:hypothetical protein
MDPKPSRYIGDAVFICPRQHLRDERSAHGAGRAVIAELRDEYGIACAEHALRIAV